MLGTVGGSEGVCGVAQDLSSIKKGLPENGEGVSVTG
jgi:hypothetical protein